MVVTILYSFFSLELVDIENFYILLLTTILKYTLQRNPGNWGAQKKLAQEVTTLVHGGEF